MFHQNYYPYNMNYNYGYKNNFNKFNNNLNYNNYSSNLNIPNNQKKDIDSNETIPFKDYTNCESSSSNSNTNINTTSAEKQNKFSIFGLSFEIDDLILIGLIILLFLESDKNYALIIILGLILLNVNLSDILNIF